MSENSNLSFVLGNCLAAVSAVPLENSIAATDGFQSKIHLFELDGTQKGCVDTLRPYRRLRSDGCSGYTAQSCCNSTRIYFLDENFRETDFLDLNTRRGCSCGGSSETEMTDSMTVCIGSERFAVGAFRRNAYLFDLKGKRLTRLCETAEGEVLTDFVYTGDGIFAMGTLNGNTTTISVSDNGTTARSILQSCYTLRMLIPIQNEIYGLFGKGYILNRIIKIYSNGVLNLPE